MSQAEDDPAQPSEIRKMIEKRQEVMVKLEETIKAQKQAAWQEFEGNKVFGTDADS